jgi:hypothetical protein
MFDPESAPQQKDSGFLSESSQIYLVLLFLAFDQLTVSQDCYLIFQFSRRKMERTEKLFTSDFTSGFDEFKDLPLQLSQAFRLFQSGCLSELFSQTHCKWITSLYPVGCAYIAVFAKSLTSMREAIVSGDLPPAHLTLNHFHFSHRPIAVSLSR